MSRWVPFVIFLSLSCEHKSFVSSHSDRTELSSHPGLTAQPSLGLKGKLDQDSSPSPHAVQILTDNSQNISAELDYLSVRSLLNPHTMGQARDEMTVFWLDQGGFTKSVLSSIVANFSVSICWYSWYSLTSQPSHSPASPHYITFQNIFNQRLSAVRLVIFCRELWESYQSEESPRCRVITREIIHLNCVTRLNSTLPACHVLDNGLISSSLTSERWESQSHLSILLIHWFLLFEVVMKFYAGSV